MDRSKKVLLIRGDLGSHRYSYPCRVTDFFYSYQFIVILFSIVFRYSYRVRCDQVFMQPFRFTIQILTPKLEAVMFSKSCLKRHRK